MRRSGPTAAPTQTPTQELTVDTEYAHKGVCDLMMICEPRRGFRQVDITGRRTKIEFAQSMKHIVDLYPKATVARKLEFHYTPKYGN